MNNPFVYSIQHRIHEWAELTFGSAVLLRPLANRIRDEWKELEAELLCYDDDLPLTVLGVDDVDLIAEESADVVITLLRLAGSLGFDLLEEVEKKQAMNERRTWRRHGDGTGRHIKETETA